MIEFARIWVFVALPLPILAWHVLPPSISERKLRVPPGVADRLEAVSKEAGSLGVKSLPGIWGLTLGWLAIVCALAGPHVRAGDVVTASGRDILLAVDLSASMATPDMRVTDEEADAANPVERLVVMRDRVGRFIKGREGDRIALIGFATEAYLIVPLTYDVNVVGQMLDDLNVGLPGRRTDIGRAIGLAIQSLKDEPVRRRILAVLTDGQTNAGGLSALDAADLAASLSIETHTIGFAAEIEPDAAEHLRQIAERTGGVYHPATTGDALERAYASLDAVVMPPGKESAVYLVQDLSWIPNLMALAIVCWMGWREVRIA
jgi:Ca-activated chloride channel family protein